MANKRISEYPAASTPLASADLLLVSQSGSYKKVTRDNALGEVVAQVTGTLADRAVPVMDGASATDMVTTGVKIDATTNAMYGAQQLVVDKTSDYPIVLATDKGKLFTNDGAAGAVNFTLPASATEGAWFDFAVREAYNLKVTAASGETIRSGSYASATSGYVQSAHVNATTRIAYIDSVWTMINPHGVWFTDSHTVGISGRRPSFDNPPVTTHAYSDEFDTSTLDAKWTVGGAITPTASAVQPISTLASAGVYDLSTWPSWLLVQSHNASVAGSTFTQTVSLDTSATIFFKICFHIRGFTGGASNLTTSGEGRTGIFLYNDSTGTSQDCIRMQAENTGSGLFLQAQVLNAGSPTGITAASPTPGTECGTAYCLIIKSTNAYFFYVFSDGTGGGMQYLGSLTKTGTTSLDRLLLLHQSADDSISPITGFDFVRYYSSATFAVMNP